MLNKEVDILKLADCVNINMISEQEQVLFDLLEAWAMVGFKASEQISATMDAYVFRLYQNIGNPILPKRIAYVLSHIQSLKVYLNQAFCDANMAALWNQEFYDLFRREAHHAWLPGIFLLTMLRTEDEPYKTFIPLDEEPLSMLVRCGYSYIMSIGNELSEAVSNFTATTIMKTSVSKRFYLRDDHDIFPAVLIGYADRCPQTDFLRLIANDDDALFQIVFQQFHKLFVGDLIQYQSKTTREKLATLIQHIPKEYMGKQAADWEQIRQEAVQYISEEE